MGHSLKTTDILGLGFMTFAFYLGAGNIILPPLAGYLAGEFMPWTMLGFLITAVGLPLVAMVAVARSHEGWTGLTQELPAKLTLALACAIYIIIGPAVATPRTALVAFEIGLAPFLSSGEYLWLYTIGFFALSAGLALNQGGLMDAIGKVLTPILFVLLAALAFGVLLDPQGLEPTVHASYAEAPFVKGILEGYNTMDALGSLMFGTLIVDMLKNKGIVSKSDHTKYLIMAGVIAAVGLSFVYISLFQLGSTSLGLLDNPTNGGAIVTAYVNGLFGTAGQVILAAIITLACLTTAIGLLSACGSFFAQLFNQPYQRWVIILAAVCTLVANIGLEALMGLSIPVLLSIYPIAVALVLVSFLKGRYANPVLAVRCVVATALIFGLFDGLNAAGVVLDVFAIIPLFSLGLGWFVPTLTMIAVGFFIPAGPQAARTPK